MIDNYAQLIFDLGDEVSLNRDDFIVSDSNKDAMAWIDSWPNWPVNFPGLNIFGAPSSGKSHLANIWKSKSNALSINAPSLDVLNVRELLIDHKNVLVDNFDNSWREENLLHLYNLIQELGGSFIIISEQPVSQMDIKLPDLASRVSTLSTVELKKPDDEIIKGVMRKLFKDRQIDVSNDVVNYLCRRMERSFKEVGRLVDRLDKISLSEKNTINLSLARRILQETC